MEEFKTRFDVGSKYDRMNSYEQREIMITKTHELFSDSGEDILLDNVNIPTNRFK